MAKKKAKKENKSGTIMPVGIVSEMEESYLSYAMSVITSRALPDIRDGLKPVHRRILYTMHEMGLTAGAKFRKSAAIVGTTLARYHPHGDTAVYDAMVNMAQDFSYRYPLVIGQGNFGSVDGDNAAAPRYTEAKMSKISEDMLRDIEKDTVDFRLNYDGTQKEPAVLPAAVPNLLLNGTLGIAVGMATNIPPHNLGEVVDACIHLIENKDASTEDLTKFIKGPDFPTGGIVYDKDLHHTYGSGKGGVTVRGAAEIIESKAGQFQIVISSIPYRTNKSDLVSSIADLVRERKVEGIKDIRDESTRDVRIVIDLKGTAIPQKVLNYLYKSTALGGTFHFNMVALVDGVPQTVSLKTILTEFVGHRKDVVKRRAQFDLKRAEEREHILLGLKKALDHISEIIKLIRASKDTADAKANLKKKFKFSERQAIAILEMKLQKLAKLERKNIEDELKEKQKLIKELKALLASPKKILNTVATELGKIKEKYGDARRTKIVAGGVKAISVEDLIPETEAMLVFTSGGYVKRSDPSAFRPQKRGGAGVVDLITKEEDFITHFITASTHSDMLFFTNLGKVYQLKMYEIPEGKRATKGKSIMNFLSLSKGEQVTSILGIPKEKKKQAQYLLLVTKGGIAKKVSTESFKDVRRSGIRAIRLSKNDELVVAFGVSSGDESIVVTAEGQSIRFKQSDIRPMSRAAGGVRAIKLAGEDVVVDAHGIQSGSKGLLLVMSENGFGKKTKIDEYKVQKRGGSGIKTAKITDKTGKLVDSKIINAEEELIAISRKGQVIRIDLDSVPTLSRATQGVKIMKLKAGDSVASMTAL